jgi:hypothetical protein
VLLPSLPKQPYKKQGKTNNIDGRKRNKKHAYIISLNKPSLNPPDRRVNVRIMARIITQLIFATLFIVGSFCGVQ